MAEVPVEVKKAPPAQTTLPDVWQSFRSEMDRLFDRFSTGFGFPSLRGMFDTEPALRSSFSFSTPAIDMIEDEKAYKISAELPGIDAKDIDVSVSGDMLVLKGEKRQEKEEKDKNYHFSERAYGSFQRAFEGRVLGSLKRTPACRTRRVGFGGAAHADDHSLWLGFSAGRGVRRAWPGFLLLPPC